MGASKNVSATGPGPIDVDQVGLGLDTESWLVQEHGCSQKERPAEPASGLTPEDLQDALAPILRGLQGVRGRLDTVESQVGLLHLMVMAQGASQLFFRTSCSISLSQTSLSCFFLVHTCFRFAFAPSLRSHLLDVVAFPVPVMVLLGFGNGLGCLLDSLLSVPSGFSLLVQGPL